MPLFILGFLLLLCLLAYSIIRYVNSDEPDDRSVRERYPDAFHKRNDADDGSGQSDSSRRFEDDIVIDADSYVEEDSLRGDIEHKLRNLKHEVRKMAQEKEFDIDGLRKVFRFNSKEEDEDDNTVEFPKDNIENEKKKRGINSD